VEKKVGDCRSGTYWLGIHKHAHCTSYVARPVRTDTRAGGDETLARTISAALETVLAVQEVEVPLLLVEKKPLPTLICLGRHKRNPA
jgi:hypothetical protein